MAMEVFDMLARRNADKLRAVGTDGASVRYHLRMNDGATGVIDAFELFDGVSLAFNNIPRGVATWNDVEPFELQIDWCLRGRFQLDGGIGSQGQADAESTRPTPRREPSSSRFGISTTGNL